MELLTTRLPLICYFLHLRSCKIHVTKFDMLKADHNYQNICITYIVSLKGAGKFWAPVSHTKKNLQTYVREHLICDFYVHVYIYIYIYVYNECVGLCMCAFQTWCTFEKTKMNTFEMDFICASPHHYKCNLGTYIKCCEVIVPAL
jgi:hypothetical protein